MTTHPVLARLPEPGAAPAEGARRIIDQQERVYYEGYWIKTYPVPGDCLAAKKNLIEALTRRLFHHTEHGLNVPGARLKEARAAYDSETDPAQRRVKGGMLAGALFNRATDIFRRLVDLQADGVEIQPDYPLVQECGHCLLEALELGRLVRRRSGPECIDELWGEPFRAFSIPLEAFYESRMIKMAQAMRDIDRIANTLIQTFANDPMFAGIEPVIHEFAGVARAKVETLRTDPAIFDVWATLVAAGERLANFHPVLPEDASEDLQRHASYGTQLICNGRAMIFYITRARVPMPKSTQDFVDRCTTYVETGTVPMMPIPLPA